jgi:hypothetical protein
LGATVKSAARRETMRAGGPEKFLVTPAELYNFSKSKFAPKCSSTSTGKSDSTTQQQANEIKIHIWYLNEIQIKQHFENHLSGRWEARSSTGPIYGKSFSNLKATLKIFNNKEYDHITIFNLSIMK